jgi:hypothetical protein
MGLSIRGYGKHRGVSHVAVKKAIDTGRITLGADGLIDPKSADQEWAQNTIHPKSTLKRAVPRSAIKAAQEAIEEPANSVNPGKGMTLLHAKTANEVVKAQMGKVRLARMKGDLVDRSQAIAHVFALARAERDALLNWPAQIAAEFAAELLEVGVSQHTVLVGLDQRLGNYLQTLGEIRPKVD